jgi:hypothetical protein
MSSGNLKGMRALALAIWLAASGCAALVRDSGSGGPAQAFFGAFGPAWMAA